MPRLLEVLPRAGRRRPCAARWPSRLKSECSFLHPALFYFPRALLFQFEKSKLQKTP